MRIQIRHAALMVCVVVLLAPLQAQKTQQKKTAPPVKKPAAAAKAAPKPASTRLQEKPVPFRPGERLTYDVSWSGQVTAGQVTITVVDKHPSYGSQAYYVVAEAKTTGLAAKLYTLYYKADSLLDVYSLVSQRGSTYSLEGKRTRMKSTVFNHAANTADYEIRTATLVKRNFVIPPSTQDPLGAIYALRAVPLRAGMKMTVPVSDNGNQFTVQLTVEGKENVKTGLGTQSAWRVRPVVLTAQGQPVGRGLALWISDDERRIPLRLRAEVAVGSFDLAISQAKM